MKPLSLARSVMVLLATFCAVVLHQNVYDDFERQRVQTARGQRPDTQGTITIQLDDLSELAEQPVALVLRLANRRPTARIVNITVDGTWLADVPLQAHRETRVDLSLPPHRATSIDQHLVLSSDDDEWLLRLLEVGNIHGFSRGLFEFVLLPASAPAPDQPGTLASFVLLALLPFRAFAFCAPVTRLEGVFEFLELFVEFAQVRLHLRGAILEQVALGLCLLTVALDVPSGNHQLLEMRHRLTALCLQMLKVLA